jgi:16S rRNA (guanine966-N2)-methyltransferase
MRIIAGELRGRKLRSPRGLDLRPTADRLKQTLFDILGPGVRGAVFLDVFAGTGSIGLEAISRGAGEVVFIECDAEGARLIRQNIELCGVIGGYRLVQQDAFSALRQLARGGFSMDVAFLDPPYDFKPYGDLLDIVFKLGLAPQGARVVIEHDRCAVLPASGERYHRTRIVRQGSHYLSFFSVPD